MNISSGSDDLTLAPTDGYMPFIAILHVMSRNTVTLKCVSKFQIGNLFSKWQWLCFIEIFFVIMSFIDFV